jgi:hypothetical protein
MWYCRCLLLPVLAASLLLLSGAHAQQPTPPAKPAPVPAPKPDATPPKADAAKPAIAPPKADPEATKTLEQALELIDPTKRLGWIETKVWQQADVQGLRFQAEGRYLAAPNNRLRLDLKVRVGGTDGEMQVVSDGSTVWQALKAGSGERVVTRWELKKVLDTLTAPGTMPQLREEFFRGQMFAGAAPLLENLQKQMTFTKQEPARWNNQDVLKLTGVWSSDVVKAITAQPDQWPYFLPRTCHLYLDTKTLWPYRLEWWGPSPPQPQDGLLLEMEFREPKLHKADEPTPPGFADAFKFEAGKSQVVDQTKDLTDQLKARAQQMALQKKTSPTTPSK